MKTQKPKRESGATARRSKAPLAVQSAPPAVPMEPVAAEVSVPEQTAPLTQDSSPILVLPSSCTVRDAAALKSQLCGTAEQDTIALDARGVERIDTAVLQLLCAFIKHCDRGSRKVQWVGASSGFTQAARLLGAATLLGLPDHANSPGAAA